MLPARNNTSYRAVTPGHSPVIPNSSPQATIKFGVRKKGIRVNDATRQSLRSFWGVARQSRGSGSGSGLAALNRPDPPAGAGPLPPWSQISLGLDLARVGRFAVPWGAPVPVDVFVSPGSSLGLISVCRKAPPSTGAPTVAALVAECRNQFATRAVPAPAGGGVTRRRSGNRRPPRRRTVARAS